MAELETMGIGQRNDERRWLGIDIGFDVSAVCVIDDSGQTVLEEEVLTSADGIGEFLHRTGSGSSVQLIGLEASPYSPHLVRGLRDKGYPVAMFDSRQARKFLRISQNKTDRNDARGLAQIALHGRNVVSEVRVKSIQCQMLRSQLVMRQHLVKNRIATESAIKAIIRLNGGDVRTATSLKRLRENVIAELERLKVNAGLDLFDTVEPVLVIAEHLRKRLAVIDNLSNGVQKGPPIGVEEGPPLRIC
ncbi:transposase [Sphingopyxis sp. LARHCG72]